MAYEMRLRGVEKWWSVVALTPLVIAWLALAALGVFTADLNLVLIALPGLAGFGWLFWYCFQVGRVYRVVFSNDAIEFATVFRRGRMPKADISGWSVGKPNSGWPLLIVLHSKRDASDSLEVPLIDARQPEVLAWLRDLPKISD